MARNTYGYGTPNWEMVGRWLELPPEQDGPFWALNLMKYREVAAYAEGDEQAAAISGKEADDAYSPLGPLAAIGAMVTFHGDVLAQRVGAPAWDRIGIVRYPSRAAFFAMQQRDDFKKQHTHKEAGMEFTIVMATHPESHDASVDAGEGQFVLTVERVASGTPAAALPGVTNVATFSVEGVIVGDERTWSRVRFDRADDEIALDAIVASALSAEDAVVVVVDRAIDNLIESIVTAPVAQGS